MDLFGFDPRFLLFEATALVVLAACVAHAARRPAEGGLPRRWHLAELAGAFLFGLVSEWVNVSVLHGYRFGRFALTIGPVPFAIPALWASIVYCAMLSSDRAGLPEAARPFADALLAVFTDVTAELVSVRLGFWTWDLHAPERMWIADWFGVPYVNFSGWLIVVGGASAAARVLRRVVRARPAWRRGLAFVALPLAVLACEAVLYAANRHGFEATRAGRQTLAIVLGPMVLAAVVVSVAAPWSRGARPLDGTVFGVAIAGHVSVLALGAAPLADPPPAWVAVASAAAVALLSAAWIASNRWEARRRARAPAISVESPEACDGAVAPTAARAGESPL